MKESREFAMACLTLSIFGILIALGTASEVSTIARVVAWVLLVPATLAVGVAIRNYRRFAKRYHAENQERLEQRFREQAAEHSRSLREQ